jgi:hypothetical protein
VSAEPPRSSPAWRSSPSVSARGCCPGSCTSSLSDSSSSLQGCGQGGVGVGECGGGGSVCLCGVGVFEGAGERGTRRLDIVMWEPRQRPQTARSAAALGLLASPATAGATAKHATAAQPLQGSSSGWSSSAQGVDRPAAAHTSRGGHAGRRLAGSTPCSSPSPSSAPGTSQRATLQGCTRDSAEERVLGLGFREIGAKRHAHVSAGWGEGQRAFEACVCGR